MKFTLAKIASLVGTVALLLPGCTSSRTPDDGTTFRSPNFDTALEEGFAVTPVAADPRIADAREATVLFTNEFHAALEAVLPGTELVPPQQTLSLLDAEGGGAHARLRSLRRSLFRNEPLDHDELDAIGRVVLRRYLLVGWIEETTTEVSSGGGYYTHGAGDAPRGTTERTVVDPLTYLQVAGTASAVIVDLDEAEILWWGNVAYETERNDGRKGDLEEGLARTRASAAIRLAEQITSTAEPSPALADRPNGRR